jgi:hypothetical protein
MSENFVTTKKLEKYFSCIEQVKKSLAELQTDHQNQLSELRFQYTQILNEQREEIVRLRSQLQLARDEANVRRVNAKREFESR